MAIDPKRLRDILANADDRITETIRLIRKRITNRAGLHGELDVLHIRDGKVIGQHHFKNVITSTGKAEVAGLINGDTSGAFTYLAIGIGTTSEVVGDTALESEITSGGGSRASATCSRTTTSVTNDTAQWVHTWTFSSTFAVTESGIFDAASDGVMLARKTFSAINVVSGDQIQITWKVQVSASYDKLW